MAPIQQPEADEGGQAKVLGPTQRSLLPRQLAEVIRLGLAKSRHALDARLAAWFGIPLPPTVVDVANETDALIALEIRHGCTAGVESSIDDLRQKILQNKATYAATPAENEALDRLWVNLLRLGLFDELVHLMRYHDLPFRREVRTFVDYCAREYGACERRGKAYRANHPGADIFTMGCIVWGEEYVGNFLRYNLRSMLSQNNLPALRAQGPVVCVIVTDAAGKLRISRDALFDELSRVSDVEFVVLPDEMIGILSKGHLVQNFYILYGMLDHCSIFFAQGATSHLFMIPVDSIVADGSLNAMANIRHEGYECCGGGNIVAETETFLPALAARYSSGGPIQISTDELATLAAQHAHHYFRSQIIAAENTDFGKHPREIFWPVDGGVEIHSVFIHPLFTSASGLARYGRKHFANVDYGMIPRMFSEPGPIKIIEDTRQAYVNNFTAGSRRYETTGRAFAIEDFMRSHDHSYPVQKSLFGRPQVLPCRLSGWTSYGDVSQDVDAIRARFAPGENGDALKRLPPQSEQ